MKLHLGRPEPLDYATLISSMPDSEFKNLTRSTIPLLAYWVSPYERLDALCNQLGVPVPDDMRLCFEYPVASVGRAKPSFTDIMGIADSLGVAIEGKSTEGDYDSIEDWLAKGGVSRPPVLKNWLRMIAKKTGMPSDPIDLPTFNDVIYQMIHRTASACSLDKPRTVVVYQVFHVKKKKLPEYKAKLTMLAAAIGAVGKIDILLNIIPTYPTETYDAVEIEIKKVIKDGDAKCVPQLVRNAVLEGSLFEFEAGTWEPIC